MTSTPTPMYTTISVQLPDECYGVPPEYEDAWGHFDFEPCSDFEFSPDGRLLGFLAGPEVCGRSILILNTQTAEVVYRSGTKGGLGFEFLDNGKVLLAGGHCEGGYMNLLDLTTGKLSGLGGLGSGGWNNAHTAIAVETGSYRGAEAAVWGYNAEKDFLFLPQTETWAQLDNHLLWAPDESHILYLHRPVSYTLTSNTYTFSESRQIIRVSAVTGEKQVLASDPQYDYNFCEGICGRCDKWYGDWIQVRRIPFMPQSLAHSDDFYRLPAVTCLSYSIDCEESPELFALNWRTGELVPWNEIPVSTLAPISAKTYGIVGDSWFIP